MSGLPASDLGRRVYGISELLAGVRGLLEDRVGAVWVCGELSNVHRASSGHVYLTLKDAGGQLRAALFRTYARRLRFELEDGLEVLVHGELTVYEPRGDLQLKVWSLEPRGQGALQLAFEQLRQRLEGEGLFDPARKRPLPALPRRIGVVTSATGAALHDVIQVTGRRLPGVPLLLAPARVQGEGAEEEIVAALEAVARCEDVDVILLVRGGGSLEDLQAFNTERLARALRACPIPVVCGVGHEVDVTIADLAADARAPTPSAAAALALPDRAALALRVERDARRLRTAGRAILERAAARLSRSARALSVQAPEVRIAAGREGLEAATRRLRRGLDARLARARAGLGAGSARLHALSPLAVLGRGYALVQRLDSGAVVRSVAQVAVGEELRVRLAVGELEVAVRERSEPDPIPGRRDPWTS